MRNRLDHKTRIRRVLAVAALAMAASCSSIYTLDIRSNPAGAWIFVDGKEKGTAPAKIQVDFSHGGDVVIQLVLKDHEPKLHRFTEAEVAANPRKTFTLAEL